MPVQESDIQSARIAATQKAIEQVLTEFGDFVKSAKERKNLKATSVSEVDLSLDGSAACYFQRVELTFSEAELVEDGYAAPLDAQANMLLRDYTDSNVDLKTLSPGSARLITRYINIRLPNPSALTGWDAIHTFDAVLTISLDVR
jgi:hypothetical protein